QFSLGAPSVILALPLFSRLEPYGKCFGKVFSGMGLGVPCIQIEYVIAAPRLWLIPFRVGDSIRPEDIGPAWLRMKLERVIDGVARFVPQNSHAFAFAGPLDFQHLSPFKFDKTGVREIKRYRKAGYSIGRKPFF